MPSLQSLFSTNSGITDAELTIYSHTTASLADDASSTYDFTIAKSALIKSVSSSVPSRLRLYSSASARTADSRDGNTTANPPEGLLIDVEFTATPDTVLFTPLEIIGNQESPLNSTIYAKIFNLSGGASTVAVTIEAYSLSQQINQREVLTADRTYYVRTDGNDNNDGLTSDTAFATIQKALDTVGMLDISTYNITIQVADGTYNLTSSLIPRPGIGDGKITIRGNLVTPSNVIISSSSVTPLINMIYMKSLYIEGIKFVNSKSGYSGAIKVYGNLYIGNVNFGACTGFHLLHGTVSATIFFTSNYTISGSTGDHVAANFGGSAFWHPNVSTVTMLNTPNFSYQFIAVGPSSVFDLLGCTFSGSSTGKSYTISPFGYVRRPVTLPGNIAGTVHTQGYYGD